MQELFGYCLLKEYRIEKAVMFLGTGRNGKGKSIELMKRFLGAENCCAVPIQALEENRFMTAELFGKMANLAGDLSKSVLKNTGIFKNSTGRDLLTGDRKFLPPIYFINYGKHIFACNELPINLDNSDAFWNRWVLFDFPFKFLKLIHQYGFEGPIVFELTKQESVKSLEYIKMHVPEIKVPEIRLS